MKQKDMNIDQLFQADLIKQRIDKKKGVSNSVGNIKLANEQDDIDDMIRELDTIGQEENTNLRRLNTFLAGPKFFEKYLQISDIMAQILANTEMYLEDKLAKINNRPEKIRVIYEFLLGFLLATQDVINYD